MSGLGRGPARWYQRRIGADGLGEPAVQLAALAGQQLVVDGLADQRVPEHEALGVGQQHVGGDRGPQRPGQPGVVLPGDRGQQRVPDPVAGRARDPDQLLGVLRQPPYPRHQQIPQRLRQAGAQLTLTEQRLHEQRVALGAPVHRVEQVLTRLVAEEPGHELAGVLAR
jgi:hypothetical protein